MLVATFQLEPEAVALADTLTAFPSIEVQAERVAAHATVWTMPCLWVSADDFGAVDEAIAADSSVERVVGSTEFIDQKYYQIDWDDGVDERIDSYIDHEGSVLNARATGDGWRVRVRFVSRDQFDEFRHTLHERGWSFELVSITRPEDTADPAIDLTPDQQEALAAAKEHGYFAVPRETSTRELADELDMSHQNLSKLLRRATGKLVDKSIDTSAGES